MSCFPPLPSLPEPSPSPAPLPSPPPLYQPVQDPLCQAISSVLQGSHTQWDEWEESGDEDVYFEEEQEQDLPPWPWQNGGPEQQGQGRADL